MNESRHSVHILIATGGAPHSALALETALNLAPADARLIVLSVAPAEARRARAEQILQEAEAEAALAGFAIETEVRIGRTAPEIVRCAADRHVDLIVIGERPRHRLRTRLLGSVTTYVAEHAPCSVLIAKEAQRPIHRVLICDSGGGTPPVVRLYAESPWLHRLTHAAQVRLLHVMSQIAAAPGVPAGQLSADAAQLIAGGAPEGKLLAHNLLALQAEGYQVEPVVRHGLVVDEIMAEMREGNYDLLIIGAHRENGWQRYLLTDVARAIISRANRPVLLLRQAKPVPGTTFRKSLQNAAQHLL